jgi:signal peptidase I
MNDTASKPPKPPARLDRRAKIIIIVAIVPAILVSAPIVLRIFGLLRPFSIPANSMAPAVSTGDHVLMEDLTFLGRNPRHGDVVVFRTDGIAGLQSGIYYVKRVAAEPGEHVHLLDGKLFINDKQLTLSNKAGEIVYNYPSGFGSPPVNDITVPAGQYFLLGDNSTNSMDSRFFGSVPRENIVGRICFCYWPSERIGGVK